MLSDEEKEIFNNLKEYMQSEINKGYHKFIYNDLDWDFKCIDCINAIDNVLNLIEKQSKEIEHQIEKRANQKKELDRHKKTEKSLKGQIIKQNKIIDLMAEEMVNGVYLFKSKNQVIDYFTNKVEEDK